MKKVIASILFAALVGVALSSCTDENVTPSKVDGPKNESNPASWR